MRKFVLVLTLILALMLASLALADPPGGDPSNGNGSHGGAGCDGVDKAQDRSDGRGQSGAALDMVDNILDC
jgi:hypothetical protein